MSGVDREQSHAAEPMSMQAYAADHLAYIRRTMDRAGTFTAVSGRGQIAVGLVGMMAAWTSARQTPGEWLVVWLVAAAVAGVVGAAGLWMKSRALGTPILSGPGRRFAFGFAPPLLAGAILTAVLARQGALDLLPGTWLLLFGAAVIAGGALSVPPVPAMGGCFMALGVVAFIAPAAWGTMLLAIGFGVLHIAFGIVIAVKYGG
jgi:hypothetical protein